MRESTQKMEMTRKLQGGGNRGSSKGERKGWHWMNDKLFENTQYHDIKFTSESNVNYFSLIPEKAYFPEVLQASVPWLEDLKYP